MPKKKNGDSDDAADLNARLVTSPEDQAKALKWFDRARELGEKRQFDYAIEYFVNGLEFWPDAIDLACKPLHGCAVARRQTGGKKPGLRDTMKRSMNDKSAKQAFLNSMWLFGHDPESVSFIEGLVKNANRLRAEDCVYWAGGVFLRALESKPKASPKQLQTLTRIFEELGDRATERGEATFGVEAYNAGVQTVNVWLRRAPRDDVAENALRAVSTKHTILKGKYDTGDSFRESVAETTDQMELHDKQRSMQSDERVDQLVAKAERAYKEEPQDAGALKDLVDQLCRREDEAQETRAIGLLVGEYKRTDDYRWKNLADNVRMKQLRRAVRLSLKSGDDEAAKQGRTAQLKFELSVYKDRVEHYPTDLRIRFEYGVRLFQAQRYDDAIPLFQTARADPKNRSACSLYLGRCFLRKGYHSQAISALKQALEEHEFPDDDLAKVMLYWLGRAQEEGDNAEEARKTYGKILQMDYNYKDARARLDALPE